MAEQDPSNLGQVATHNHWKYAAVGAGVLALIGAGTATYLATRNNTPETPYETAFRKANPRMTSFEDCTGNAYKLPTNIFCVNGKAYRVEFSKGGDLSGATGLTLKLIENPLELKPKN